MRNLVRCAKNNRQLRLDSFRKKFMANGANTFADYVVKDYFTTSNCCSFGHNGFLYINMDEVTYAVLSTDVDGTYLKILLDEFKAKGINKNSVSIDIKYRKVLIDIRTPDEVSMQERLFNK